MFHKWCKIRRLLITSLCKMGLFWIRHKSKVLQASYKVPGDIKTEYLEMNTLK